MNNSNILFNAVDLLYLNPELSAYFGINTVEDASIIFDTTYSNTHLAYNTSILPEKFDPDVFLSTSRDLANISQLSKNITQSMLNQGILPSQIKRKQKYIANIYTQVTYSNDNVFNFVNPIISSSNALSIGDNIKILNPKSTDMFFKIRNISSDSFTVDPNNYTLYSSSNYTLFGINVTDFNRISQINYARVIQGYSNIDSYGNIVSPVISSETNYVSASNDNKFNPELYRMLYPNARGMSDTDTYLDWVNKRKNEVYRISYVKDIAFGNGNEYVNMNYLQISCNTLFKGILLDGVLTELSASLCNIPIEATKILTGNAIKSYVDERFTDLLNRAEFKNIIITDSMLVACAGTFSNDLNVYGNLFIKQSGTFSNDVYVNCNLLVNNNASISNILDVSGSVTFRNSLLLTHGNASIQDNVLVNGSMSVSGNFYNPRIGLGYMGNYLDSNNGIDIIHAQNYNDNSDKRLKTNIRQLSSMECLQKLTKINLSHFTYNYGIPEKDVDTIGCIAQELEDQGLSEFIYKTNGYIPNILTKCRVYGNSLITDVDIDIILNKEIKLITTDTYNEHIVIIIKKYERYTYELRNPISISNGIECLLYGYKITDLYNVDYKKLFVITIGAVQQLYKLLTNHTLHHDS